jgi:hypothetical protein
VTPFEKWRESHGVDVDDWFLTNDLASVFCIPVGSEVGIAHDDGSDEPYFFVKGEGHRYLHLDMIEPIKPKDP